MNNPVTPLSPLATANQELGAGREGYVKRVLIGLDMFGAVLFGAKNDQTISSDAAIAAVADTGFKRGYGRTMSAFLDIFQRDHGAKAVAGDEERAESAAAAEANSGLIATSDSSEGKPPSQSASAS